MSNKWLGSNSSKLWTHRSNGISKQLQAPYLAEPFSVLNSRETNFKCQWLQLRLQTPAVTMSTPRATSATPRRLSMTMRFQHEQKCHCFILCTWLAQMLGCPYGRTSSWICWNHHSNRFCQLPGGFARFGVVNMSILSELQNGSILRPEAHQGRP